MKKRREVRIAAAGVARRGGAVRRCVNLTEARHGLKRMMPLPSLPAGDDEDGSDDGAAYSSAPASYAPVRLVARSIGRMQRQTRAFTPADGDAGSDRGMGERDMAAFSAMLSDTYCGLVEEAAGGGALLQPIACGYRLTGHDGQTLYESGVVYAGPADGVQLCGELHPAIEVRSNTDFTIAGFTLGAEAYRLTAEIPEYGADDGVAEVEIYAGEQLHPVDPSERAEIRIDGAGGSEPSVRLFLPGASTAMAPGLQRLTAKAAALAAGGMRGMRLVARVRSGEAATVTVGGASRGDVAEAIRLADAAVARAEAEARHARTAEGRLLAAICSPNGFDARLAVRSGDTMVMGGITPLRFGGVSPLEMVTAPEGNDVIALRATVTGPGLPSAVSEAVMTGDFNGLRRAPLVGYPSADASELHITATCGGKSVHFGAMLTPAADLSRAIHVACGLASPTPDDEAAPEYADVPMVSAAARIDNALVASESGRNRHPVAACLLGEGVEVKEMVIADRRRTSADSTRCRLYASTTDGIYGASADLAEGRLTATNLTPLVAEGRLTASGDGYYASTAEGVVELTGSQVKAVEGASRWKRAGRDPATGLLLTEDAAGMIWTSGSDGTEYMADREHPDEVEWTVGAELSADERVRGIELRMRASEFHGEVEIMAGGKRTLQRICRVKVDGEICRPLRIGNIICPVRPYVELRLTGRTSADLRIYSAAIETIKVDDE